MNKLLKFLGMDKNVKIIRISDNEVDDILEMVYEFIMKIEPYKMIIGGKTRAVLCDQFLKNNFPNQYSRIPIYLGCGCEGIKNDDDIIQFKKLINNNFANEIYDSKNFSLDIEYENEIIICLKQPYELIQYIGNLNINESQKRFSKTVLIMSGSYNFREFILNEKDGEQKLLGLFNLFSKVIIFETFLAIGNSNYNNIKNFENSIFYPYAEAWNLHRLEKVVTNMLKVITCNESFEKDFGNLFCDKIDKKQIQKQMSETIMDMKLFSREIEILITSIYFTNELFKRNFKQYQSIIQSKSINQLGNQMTVADLACTYCILNYSEFLVECNIEFDKNGYTVPKVIENELNPLSIRTRKNINNSKTKKYIFLPPGQPLSKTFGGFYSSNINLNEDYQKIIRSEIQEVLETLSDIYVKN